VDFELVQKEVAEMTKGRIVVGHALENDFKVGLLLCKETREKLIYY